MFGEQNADHYRDLVVSLLDLSFGEHELSNYGP